MASIRLLKRKDLEKTNHLLVSAFTEGRKEDGYADTQINLCHIKMLEMYLSFCPNGCFTLVEKGEILAAAFSHVLGSTGWIGPIAVAPAFRGKKLGEQITRHCIDFLKSKKCSTIGLETMPRSYRNLGFYINLGFRPQQLTCELTRFIQTENNNPRTDQFTVDYFSKCKGRQQSRFLNKAAQLTNFISPKTNYNPLIKNTTRYDFGDTLFLEKEGLPFALFVVHTEPYSVKESRNLLRTCLMIIASDRVEEIFPSIITILEQFAIQENLNKLYIRVPANYWDVTRWLSANHFRIVHSDLRMTLNGYHEIIKPGVINLNRWE